MATSQRTPAAPAATSADEATTRNTSIRIPIDLWEDFHKVAQAEHRSRGAIVRQFVEQRVSEFKAATA